MSSYLTIAVVCLLIARFETFQLTRGLKDKFANPECVNGDSCFAGQCAQYFARCETESCTVCVCDEVRPTYVASQKRCVKHDDIFPLTGRLLIIVIYKGTRALINECFKCHSRETTCLANLPAYTLPT